MPRRTPRLVAALSAAALVTSPLSLTATAETSDDFDLLLSSRDAAAFDFAEYDGPGSYDTSVAVVSRSGRGFSDERAPDGAEVRYYWTINPFDPSAEEIRVPDTEGSFEVNDDPRYTGDGDALGGDIFDVPFPAQQAVPGVHTLHATLVTPANEAETAAQPPYAAIDSVTAGNAALTLDQDELVADLEEVVRISGTLALEDGTTLPRRFISLDYTPATDRGARSATFLPYSYATRPLRARTSTGRVTDRDGIFEAYLAGNERTPCESTAVAESGTLSVAAEQIPVDSPFLRGDLPWSTVQGDLYAPGDPVPTQFGQASDDPPAPVHPLLSLRGRSNGAQDDFMLAKGGRLIAGEVVRLYRTGLGRGRQLVGRDRAGYRGNVGFTVPDRNGRRPATYRAVMHAGAACTVPSNRQRIR
ncbi:hypothetical protein KLP28_12375 [Nocardioidaceae bacterium]|nr:hypothetical protein KLP28_12375 [Nocardioidaceae bacterium]